MLNGLELERMQLEIHIGVGGVHWACKRWAHSKSLKMHVTSKIPEEDVAGLKLSQNDDGPQYLQVCELSAVFKNAAAGRIFQTLLASLQCSAQLEMLNVCTQVESLPRLLNLKHLHLSETYFSVEIGHLVGSLPCLEVLEFSYPRFDWAVDLDLRHADKLQRLMLNSMYPSTLDVPPACSVSLLEVDEDCSALSELWQECPARESVDTLYMRHHRPAYPGHPDSDDTYSLFERFPKLKMLDIDVQDDDGSQTSLVFVLDMYTSPTLAHLTCLRLVLQVKHTQNLEVSIPGYMALKSLILVASRIKLMVESPDRLSTSLEEMIMATDGYYSRNYYHTIMDGSGYIPLRDCLAAKGTILATTLCPGVNLYDYKVYNENPVHTYGFAYLLPRGAKPKSYEALRRRVCGCLCGVCWCCKCLDGDRALLKSWI